MKELSIDCGITQNRAALFVNGVLEDLYIENVDFNSINGNIYRGKIENIEEGLSAIFINIGIGKNALLHIDSSSELKKYKRGQEVIVQVIREASGSKGPRVSTSLSIPGEYIVMLPGDNYVGVSKKIDNLKLRKKIKTYVTDFVEDNYGIIVRTHAADMPLEALNNDYYQLKERWKSIENNSKYLKTPALLFDSKNFYDYLLREYIKNDIDKIYLNRTKEVEFFSSKFSSNNSDINPKLVYDEYNFTMQDKIENEIENACQRTIPLPAGGYISIDFTEAFICIDVNSGSYTGNDNMEQTVLSVNLEACKAIERAIKIRKLSGIILIDFIDMKLEKNRENIIAVLNNAFYYDNSNFKIFGFTKLGILETTRTKNGKCLQEFIYTNYNSSILNSAYCLKLIENKAVKNLLHYKLNYSEVNLEAVIYDNSSNLLEIFITNMKIIYSIELKIIRNTTVKGFSFIVNK